MDVHEFKQRFVACSRSMYWTAYRLTGSDATAEDIVQDVFLKLWTNRYRLYDVANAEAYCLRMVRNACFDRRRAGRLTIVAADGESRHVAADDDVGHGIEQRQLADMAIGMIEKLPEQQRRIIILKDVDDRSYDEISSITGMTGSNIRATLSRARKAVRKMIEHTGLL